MESLPWEGGSLVMKSPAITAKCHMSGSVVMRKRWGLEKWWTIVLAWQVVHPFTYSFISFFIAGHQMFCCNSWNVFIMPGWPQLGGLWKREIALCLKLLSPMITRAFPFQPLCFIWLQGLIQWRTACSSIPCAIWQRTLAVPRELWAVLRKTFMFTRRTTTLLLSSSPSSYP